MLKIKYWISSVNREIVTIVVRGNCISKFDQRHIKLIHEQNTNIQSSLEQKVAK